LGQTPPQSRQLGQPLPQPQRQPVKPQPGGTPAKPGTPAAPESTGAMLSRKYGIEPLPESVVQLTRLVARREACAEEIAKIVQRDPAISRRLLQFANPKAMNEAEFVITEVGDALMRTGMSPVILLAMVDPLIRAVIKAFEMTKTHLVHEPLTHWHPFQGAHALGIVGFSGNATGVVHIRLESAVAHRLAAAIIDVDPKELTDPAEIDDVIGELVNIVAGNLKSNLCDAGIPCTLTPPKVERAVDCRIITIPGGVSERLGFLGPDFQVLVDVSVNPWSG
jgi:chemotaxis protein CheX